MKQLQRGVLIAIEGIDGSGKSTFAQNLADHLIQDHYSVLLTKEPGGSSLGKILRPLLQGQKVIKCPEAEFLLFAADRAQHFNEVIIPALDKQQLVISDRLSDSSLVYQGFGRGLSIPLLETINSWAMKGIKPHITFYLRVPLEIALDRLNMRNVMATTFEQDKELLQKALHGFDTLYAQRNDVFVLDGQQEPQQIYTHAFALIKKLGLL